MGGKKKKPEPGKAPSAGSKAPKAKARSHGASHFHGDLERELAALGLRCKKVAADGNCMFRALSDNLQGDEGKHAQLRQQIVDFMQEHADLFQWFVEDDQDFDGYCKRMRKDGVWGGQMELQAAAMLLERNMNIHQAGQPLWRMQNFPPAAPELHLSYHDGDHYNSVRLFDDYGKGPPAPIKLGSNGAAAATQAARSWGLAEEQVVVNNTGCDSPALVAKALRQAGGNVDLAVEMVIEWMGEEGGGEGDGEGVGEAAGGSGPGAAAGAALQEAQPAAHAASDSRAAAGAAAASGGEAGRAAGGCAEGGTEGCPGEAGDGGCGPPSSSCSAEADGGSQAGGGGTARSQQQEQESGPPSEHSSTGRKQGQPAPKKPARNKPCACGSGRKHKDCCGAAKAAAERRKKALLDSLDTTEVVASVATLCI